MMKYAGFDPDEDKPGYLPDFRVHNPVQRRALNLFRVGADTVEIAAKIGCTEARALELVTLARSRIKWLSNPYDEEQAGRTAG